MLHYIGDATGKSGKGTPQFTTAMHVPENHNKIALVAACIPKTFYNIDGANRDVSLYYSFRERPDEKSDWGAWERYVTKWTIPPGNWSAGDIANMFNKNGSFTGKDTGENPANSGGPTPIRPAATVFKDTGFALEFLEQESRFYVTTKSTANTTLTEWSLSAVRFQGILGKQLGFSSQAPDTWYSVTGTETYIPSQSVANLITSNSFYITCSAVRDPYGHTSYGSVLSHFYPHDRPAAAFVVYENRMINETSRQLTTYDQAMRNAGDSAPVNVYDVQFTLLDDAGSPVWLNGAHWTMVIRTWHEDQPYELMRRYVNMELELAAEKRIVDAHKLAMLAKLQQPVAEKPSK